MKTGFAGLVFICVRLCAMQGDGGAGSAAGYLPGAIEEKAVPEQERDRLDAQVATCISDLVSCKADLDFFYNGSDKAVHALFAKKGIDPKAVWEQKFDPSLLVCTDVRVTGMEYEKRRGQELEKKLLAILAQGGTFKKIPVSCLRLDRQVLRSTGDGHMLGQQEFFWDDVPRLLAKHAHPGTLRALLAADSDFAGCIKDPALLFGHELLWHAVGAGSVEHVRILLESGVDPLIAFMPSDPRTPYHYAASSACPPVLSVFLMAFQGNLEKINTQSMPTPKKPRAKTALDYALGYVDNQVVNQKSLAEVICMLREAGCKTAAELAAMSEAERELFFHPKDAFQKEARPEQAHAEKRVQFDENVTFHEISNAGSSESAQEPGTASPALGSSEGNCSAGGTLPIEQQGQRPSGSAESAAAASGSVGVAQVSSGLSAQLGFWNKLCAKLRDKCCCS